jgi:hypothetical protein
MALNVQKGVITAPLATGNQTYSLPASFDCKALILWSARNTAAGTQADGSFSLGFGTYDGGVVQHMYSHIFSDDAAAASVISAGASNNAILRGNSGDNVLDFEIDLVSLGAADFVLNYVDAPAAAIKIHYIALGGSDITGARAFTYTDSTTTPQDVTVNAGFGQPDLLFLTGRAANGLGDAAGTSSFSLSVAKSATERRSTAIRMTDASAASTMASTQRALAYISAASSAFTEIADLDVKANWPTDGFRLVKTITTARDETIVGLALKGTFQAAIGATTAPTAGGTPVNVDLTGGFTPKLGMVWGWNLAANASLVTSGAGDQGSFMIGATDGTNEGWAGITEDVGSLVMVSKSLHSESKTVAHYTPTLPALQSEADGLFSGTNFRLAWNDIDTVARESNYLILGDAPAASTTHHLSLLGVGS